MSGSQKRKIRKEKEYNINSKYAKLDDFLISASSSSCASSSNARELDEQGQAHPVVHKRRIWKEDGETAEFLTDDDIAEAVTQEPMEEEGSDDETQCDKKDVVLHADGAAALRYLEQQPDTTPADVLFMRH
ncbi:hypothetical protein TNCV_4804231 [Trichonephila clavipes]|nr:hypothetical protein TNCV_4804231 [Trichonephila clavipes]